ncbi:hypothetical protein [Stenotrophomonas muris]|uniref:hypothetical protein n=1 Tax=Stenotrophomonas muris TaxID=2963283 RepID=UPI002E75AC13|nr:hypothetical protein [Stenotrophomonas muris]
MGEEKKYSQHEKEFAREIYARGVAARIGAGEAQLNADYAVYQALEAAEAFFRIVDEN